MQKNEPDASGSFESAYKPRVPCLVVIRAKVPEANEMDRLRSSNDKSTFVHVLTNEVMNALAWIDNEALRS